MILIFSGQNTQMPFACFTKSSPDFLYQKTDTLFKDSLLTIVGDSNSIQLLFDRSKTRLERTMIMDSLGLAGMTYLKPFDGKTAHMAIMSAKGHISTETYYLLNEDWIYYPIVDNHGQYTLLPIHISTGRINWQAARTLLYEEVKNFWGSAFYIESENLLVYSFDSHVAGDDVLTPFEYKTTLVLLRLKNGFFFRMGMDSLPGIRHHKLLFDNNNKYKDFLKQIADYTMKKY